MTVPAGVPDAPSVQTHGETAASNLPYFVKPAAGVPDVAADSATIEYISRLACDLLAALQPWGMQSPEIRSAATRLTVALAALPLPHQEEA